MVLQGELLWVHGTNLAENGPYVAQIDEPVDASDYTKINFELASNKGVASGYAGLDATGKVPAAQLPPAPTQQDDHTALTKVSRDTADQHPIGAVTGLQAAIDAKFDAPDKPEGTVLLEINGSILKIYFPAIVADATPRLCNFKLKSGTSISQLSTSLVTSAHAYDSGGTRHGDVRFSGPILAKTSVLAQWVQDNSFVACSVGDKVTGSIHSPWYTIDTSGFVEHPKVLEINASGVLGLTSSLNFKEDKSNRNAVNGYAPLDANKRLPTANLPAVIDGVELKSYTETVKFHPTTRGTEAINLADGMVHTITLYAGCVLTFIGATTRKASSVMLIINQDMTGNRIVTWPGSVKWAGGTAPTLSTAPNSIDVLTLATIDGGATWIGFVSGLDFK